MTGKPDLHERIATYLDGAMSESEAQAFEQEVGENPSLAAELERLMGNDALLRAAYAEPEIDDGFLARMGLEPQTGPANTAPALAMPANDNPPLWRRWQLPVGGAIAAGLALALTLTFQNGAGGNRFNDALDTTPSGQMAALDEETSLTPVLSFEAGDGRFCREFAYSAGSSDRGGIACRGTDGWTIEAWGEGAGTLPDPGEIALASGADTRSLDEAYRALGASDPISADRESALINKGWNAE